LAQAAVGEQLHTQPLQEVEQCRKQPLQGVEQCHKQPLQGVEQALLVVVHKQALQVEHLLAYSIRRQASDLQAAE